MRFMMSDALNLAFKHAVDSSMGVYPKKFNGKERTEYQNGWNDAVLAYSSRFFALRNWYYALSPEMKLIVGELLQSDDEPLLLNFENDKFSLQFCTSDLFFSGYSDWETIRDDEMLKEFYAAWKDKGGDGIDIWWCKNMKMRPKRSIQDRWKENGMWDEELENLPEPN